MDLKFLNFLAVILGIGLTMAITVGAMHLFKALASRLERRPALAGEDELAALHTRMTDLEQRILEQGGVSERLAELEERVDFAERLLSRGEGAGKG
jgi:hypothetical protein